MHPRSSTVIPTLLSASLLVIGLVVAVLGVRYVRQHAHRRRTWRHEQAVVTGYEWSGDVQHWIMERNGYDGRRYQRRTRFGLKGGTLRSFPFDVEVLVNPADEADFVLARGLRSGSGAWLMVVGGLALTAFGLMGLRILLPLL